MKNPGPTENIDPSLVDTTVQHEGAYIHVMTFYGHIYVLESGIFQHSTKCKFIHIAYHLDVINWPDSNINLL